MNNTPQNQSKSNEIIDVSEEQTCNYWTNRLGVTTEVLKSAIRASRCVNLDDVTAYLIQHKVSHLAYK